MTKPTGSRRQNSTGIDFHHGLLALNTQSTSDINLGIIEEIRRSDYYILIDFRREHINCNDDSRFRGSLFAHQELAIAYSLDFEHTLFFREERVLVEGFAAFMASNATIFTDREDLPNLVRDMVVERQWSTTYSRNLKTGRLHVSPVPIRTPTLVGKFFFVDIHNGRSEKGALGAIARLAALQLDGKQLETSPNKSPLKVTGQAFAFEQTIWPQNHGAFDLLCVNGRLVYLHSRLDVQPTPIIDQLGTHRLHYEVYAHGFDRLKFVISLKVTGDFDTTEATIVQPN